MVFNDGRRDMSYTYQGKGVAAELKDVRDTFDTFKGKYNPRDRHVTRKQMTSTVAIRTIHYINGEYEPNYPVPAIRYSVEWNTWEHEVVLWDEADPNRPSSIKCLEVWPC